MSKIFYEMGNVLNLLILCMATVGTSKASDISGCLALAGIDVAANLIERTSENNTEYVDINFQWQERGEHRLPIAYLKVQTASDVQFAVQCARSLGLLVVARGGGHGYLKYAYGQNDDLTLVVDLHGLNTISVNREVKTATIGAGARLGHVAYQLWANGNFIIPYGVCGSVGVSGYTLGGGHSIFSYLHGMGSDNVIEMEMVNASGELLTINNRTNVDLFWALRGAGISASFGIVTKFVFQLHTAPHQIVTGIVHYSFERFLEFYSLFQTYMVRTHERQMFYAFTVNASHVSAVFYDVQSTTDAENVGLNSVMEALDLFPSPDYPLEVDILPFREFLTSTLRITRYYGYMRPNFEILEPSDLMKIDRYGTGTEWFKSKSIFVEKLLTTNEMVALQQLLINITLPGIYISAETFVGKIHDFDAQTDSAFIHRNAYYYMYIYMIREKDDDPDLSNRFSEFFESSKDILGHTRSYQNYPDDEMSDFLERYYGENLPRLIDIKTEVDPDDFFNTNPQSIPVRRGSGSGSTSTSVGLRTILISLCAYLCSMVPLLGRF